MRKNSTLTYFVKKIKPERVAANCNIDGVENSFEKAEYGQMTPSEQTINNIFAFAQSYEVIQTERNGFVEMILN